jgi:hypothetical protein
MESMETHEEMLISIPSVVRRGVNRDCHTPSAFGGFRSQ